MVFLVLAGPIVPLHVKDSGGQQFSFGKIDSPRVMSIAGGPVFPKDDKQVETSQETVMDTVRLALYFLKRGESV